MGVGGGELGLREVQVWLTREACIAIKRELDSRDDFEQCFSLSARKW